MSRLFLPGVALPIVRDVDVAVVGGSIGGLAAALAAANQGASVCVLESTTYLGSEITAALRPWLSLEDALRGDDYGLVTALIGEVEVQQEIPIWPDSAKRQLEDLIGDAGVSLLYGSRAIGVHRPAQGGTGVVIANKSGRQLVRARRVVVSSESSGFLYTTAAGATQYWFTLEVTGAAPGQQSREIVPIAEQVGLVNNSARLHAGYRGRGHVLVECSVILSTSVSHEDAAAPVDRVRRMALRVFDHLRATREEFGDSWLAGISYRPYFQRAAPESVPTSFHLLESPRPHLGLYDGGAESAKTAIAKLIDEAGIVGADAARLALGGARGEPAVGNRVKHCGPTDHEISVREPAAPPSWQYPAEYCNAQSIDRTIGVDVLVVGGGSSGASCAVSAAGSGVRTLLAELNPGLGGTGTFGGVDSYWFGRRDGLAASLRRRVVAVHRRVNLVSAAGRGWNLEVKADAFLGAVEDAGALVLTDTIAFAVLMNDDRVQGAVFATPDGVVAVRSNIVVDATGDADLAVAAGAPTRTGADRTHSAMWYSLAQFVEPGRTKNNFGGVVDAGDVEDYTRAILAARRRGGELHDHGIYVAARESRNIVGDLTMSLTDQLVRRHFEDVINVHFSNHDIKGRSESIWTLMGLIPPNLEIEVPYRALMPRGVDGLLVVGKAISVTHDGLAAVRMQSDLENLGAIAGIVAATCVAEGLTPRTIDVGDLQRKLVDLGAFSADVLSRPPGPAPCPLSVDELVTATTAATPLPVFYTAGAVRKVHRPSIAFVDLIQHEDESVNDVVASRMPACDAAARMVLARVLVCRGDRRGADALIDQLTRTLVGAPRLPERQSAVKHAQLPPDQASMPDEAYLLYTLALARDDRVIPIWEHVARRIDSSADAIRSMTAGTFAYVAAVTFGAERLGTRAALPALKLLHRQETLRDQQRVEGYEIDIFQERQAMLELGIGCALARCGDTEGLRVLVAYLRDTRGPLRNQARNELALMRGHDLGPNPEQWAHWLDGLEGWEPLPLGGQADLLAPDGIGHALAHV